MDPETQRRKRMEEIEEKKKRLEQMRKARANAEPAPEPTLAVSTSLKADAAASVVGNKAAGDMDSLISSLLANPPVPVPVLPVPPPVASAAPTSDRNERLKMLSIVKCGNVIDVIPVETVTYDKSCQTEEEDQSFLIKSDHEDRDVAYDTDKRSSRRIAPSALKTTSSWHSDATHAIGAAIAHNLGQLAAKDAGPQKVLSEDERNSIYAKKSFASFLDTASLFVERALEQNQRTDILRDYTVDTRGGDQRVGSSLFDVLVPYEDESVHGRPVMDVRFCALQPELFAVAYGSRSSSSQRAQAFVTTAPTEDSSPGCVCVWNAALHTRPEFRFSAMSAVLTAVFHITEPHIVIGGCYNGQVVLWDMRASKVLPSARSSVTGKGHKHPIFAMSMLASSTTPSILPNNELLSLSIDGLLCHWDVTQLAEPVVMINILQQSVPRNPSQVMNMLASPQSEALALTAASPVLNTSSMAVSFGENHAMQIVVGSGSGHIITTPLPVRAGGGGIKQTEAHFGLITSMHAHPSASGKYRHLLLTCSLDWSVRLWHLQHFTKPLVQFPHSSCDYVAAVRWCPSHPAVFAAITSGGKLALWNVARSCTEAQDSINLLHREDDGQTTLNAKSTSAKVMSLGSALHKGGTSWTNSSIALSQLAWTADGLSIVVGDSSGNVFNVRVHPGAVNFSSQDESKLEMVLLAAVEGNAQKA